MICNSEKKKRERGPDQLIVAAGREGADLLERDFSPMKKRGSRLYGSDDDEKKIASSATLALRLSTGSAMLAIGATKDADSKPSELRPEWWRCCSRILQLSWERRQITSVGNACNKEHSFSSMKRDDDTIE